MIYHVNEAAFTLPEFGFADRTVNVLEATGPEGQKLGLLVARSPYAPGKGLRDAVAEHQKQERRTLRAWSVLCERDSVVDGVPAVEVQIRWRSDEGMVYQRQAHIGLADVVLLFVANAPLEDREACDACMDQLLQTLSLRSGG